MDRELYWSPTGVFDVWWYRYIECVFFVAICLKAYLLLCFFQFRSSLDSLLLFYRLFFKLAYSINFSLRRFAQILLLSVEYEIFQQEPFISKQLHVQGTVLCIKQAHTCIKSYGDQKLIFVSALQTS